MKIRNRKNQNSEKSAPKNWATNTLKAAVIAGSISLAPTSSAAVGSDIFTMLSTAAANAAALIQQEIAEAAKTISHMTKSIGTFSYTTITNITNNTNSMLGAIKVATAQSSQSAQTLAEVQTQASQKLATARQTIHMQDQLLKAMRKYGGNGQGFNACVTVAENKGLDKAADQTKVIAASKETETLSAISPKASLNATNFERQKIIDQEFCGNGDPNCKASALPGGNVNGSLMFVAAEEGSKEQLARGMFRENLLGVNMQSLNTAAQVESPMGQKSYHQANRQSALLSPAAYSLAYIDAQNTKTIERDGKKYSANELIDTTVSRYYGGPESKDWQASMIVQEPRGLLVEAARLNGLSVWLQNYMYQQNLRKEANLAAILLATSAPLSEEVREVGNSAASRAIRSSVYVYK